MTERNPTIRPTDDAARRLARSLLDAARLSALGVIDPATGAPHVSRIALACDVSGAPLTLISALAAHTVALRTDPRASLLVTSDGGKGDPLNQPRLTLTARAHFLDRGTPEHAAIRTLWLKRHPKATLYVDFADFAFVRFAILGCSLNGGFAKAYELSADDLTLG